MKTKKTRICARKDCNNIVTLYKSTDKYCSPTCYYADFNEKNKANPKPKKKQKPIKRFSKKLSKRLTNYSKLRKEFLSLQENKTCIVSKIIFNKTALATEIHHKKGRKGELLNYTPYWLSVSREGHEWIHNNPSIAYSLGFLIHSTHKEK